MAFWQEYGADMLVLLIIAGMVALAVRTLIGRKRQGKSCGCDGSCSGCHGPSQHCRTKKAGEPYSDSSHRE